MMGLGWAIAVMRPTWLPDDRLRRALGIALAISAAAHLAVFSDAYERIVLIDAMLLISGLAVWRPRILTGRFADRRVSTQPG